MVQVFQFEGKWLIVWGLRLEEGPALEAATTFVQGEGRRTLFGRCWTGVKWAKQPLEAKTFQTREEAQAYLTSNRDVIELATV